MFPTHWHVIGCPPGYIDWFVHLVPHTDDASRMSGETSWKRILRPVDQIQQLLIFIKVGYNCEIQESSRLGRITFKSRHSCNYSGTLTWHIIGMTLRIQPKDALKKN